jgi:hypothetical protein
MGRFILFIALISLQAHAEYRVYQLGIKSSPTAKQEKVVTSTLDHLQYLDYYKIEPQEQVRLIDHWMCRGRTDHFKSHCSKPKPPSPTSNQADPTIRMPASN